MRKKRVCKKERKVKKKKIYIYIYIFEKEKKLCYGSGGHVHQFVEKNEYVPK